MGMVMVLREEVEGTERRFDTMLSSLVPLCVPDRLCRTGAESLLRHRERARLCCVMPVVVRAFQEAARAVKGFGHTIVLRHISRLEAISFPYYWISSGLITTVVNSPPRSEEVS